MLEEITKEDVLKLRKGTRYYIYNPLTERLEEKFASENDIAHNKYCYEKLKFFIGVY